jgi:hypothetical protein
VNWPGRTVQLVTHPKNLWTNQGHESNGVAGYGFFLGLIAIYVAWRQRRRLGKVCYASENVRLSLTQVAASLEESHRSLCPAADRRHLHTFSPSLRLCRHEPDEASAHLGIRRAFGCTLSRAVVDARELVQSRAGAPSGFGAVSS